MKKKFKKIPAQFPEIAAPVSASADNSSEEIPPGLEFFAKLQKLSPLDQAAAISPKLAAGLKTDNAPAIIEALAGIFSGAGLDLGVPLPEWVKTASEKCWQGMGCDFIREIPELKMDAIGKFFEMMNLMIKDDDASPVGQAVINLKNLIKNDTGNLTPDELSKFAKGRMAVPKIIDKGKNLSERLFVFIRIVSAWRHVEKLGSHAKTHQWLLDNKIISPNTERAETSKWFREIGLPKGKAGRPKKNTDSTKIE